MWSADSKKQASDIKQETSVVAYFYTNLTWKWCQNLYHPLAWFQMRPCTAHFLSPNESQKCRFHKKQIKVKSAVVHRRSFGEAGIHLVRFGYLWSAKCSMYIRHLRQRLGFYTFTWEHETIYLISGLFHDVKYHLSLSLFFRLSMSVCHQFPLSQLRSQASVIIFIRFSMPAGQWNLLKGNGKLSVCLFHTATHRAFSHLHLFIP